MEMNKLVVGVLLVALVCTTSARAQATCTGSQDCTVSGAQCVAGNCRLNGPPLLFPTASPSALTLITLQGPPDRSIEGDSPSFQWVFPAGADLLVVGIFKHSPTFAVSGQQILNQEDVEWLWQSSPDGTGPGSSTATYNQGHQYTEDDASMCVAASPPPLAGGVHYWGAWAFAGGNLTARSEVRSFSAGSEPITGSHCGDTSGCGDLPGVNCFSGAFFCVIQCASDADCFASETCTASADPTRPWGTCRRAGECPCPDNETCDSDLQICYSGAAAQESGGCSCGDGGTGSGGGGGGTGTTGAPLCAPLVGLALYSARRRRPRRDDEGSDA
jgi:hypothetical protein